VSFIKQSKEAQKPGVSSMMYIFKAALVNDKCYSV